MSLAALDLDSPVAKLADWFELSALISQSNASAIGDVKSMLLDSTPEAPLEADLDQGVVAFGDMPSKDFQESDTAVESMVAAVQAEISQRAQDLDGSYPFEMNNTGDTLTVAANKNFGKYVYLYCLIVSHSNKEGVLEAPIRPKLKDKDRDVFQICATAAASGFMSGPAISFGWPRPDGSSAHSKLLAAHSHFGEQALKIRPRRIKGTQPKLKDDGIDVICWEVPKGKKVAFSYGLGQAATGLDWTSKSVSTEIPSFLNTWYEVEPSRHSVRPLMLIPFDPASNISGDEDAVLMEIRKQNDRLGRLIDRDNLPMLAQLATTFDAAKITPIERLNEQNKVKKWVEKFIAKAKGE